MAIRCMLMGHHWSDWRKRWQRTMRDCARCEAYEYQPRVLDFTARHRMWGHNIEFVGAPGTAMGWGDSPEEGDIILHEFRGDATGDVYVARLRVTERGWMWGVKDGWRISYVNEGPTPVEAAPEEKN